MNSRFKFPRRVRIHGGECGAVARALHHEAKNSSLPAVEKNVFFTTKERKQMSTKTTLKRIALVAVSALGLGLLTSGPSQAANTSTVTYTKTVTPNTTHLTVVKGSTETGTAGYFYVDVAVESASNDGTVQGLAKGSETMTVSIVEAPSASKAVTDMLVRPVLISESQGAATRSALRVVPNTTETWAATATLSGNRIAAYEASNWTPDAENAGGKMARYGFAVRPSATTGADSPAIGAGYYKVRIRTQSSIAGTVIDKFVYVRFVSTIQDAGAVVTLAAGGSLAAGEALTYGSTNYISATLRDPNGGRIQSGSYLGMSADNLDSVAVTSFAPTLTAKLYDADDALLGSASTLVIADTGTGGYDHVAPTAATYASSTANEIKYAGYRAELDGVYGVYSSSTLPTTLGDKTTNYVKVAVTDTDVSATKTLTTFGVRTSVTYAGLKISGTGVKPADADSVSVTAAAAATKAYKVPLSATSVTLTIDVDSANVTMRTKTTWSGNYATADVTPATANISDSLTNSGGVITRTITNAKPVDGAVATVLLTGFASGYQISISLTWEAAKATTLTVVEPVSNVYAALGATTDLQVAVQDQFSNYMSGQSLQPSLVSGSANYSSTKTYAAITTGTDGIAKFSLTDAAAADGDYDDVKFASINNSSASTVTYTVNYATAVKTVSTWMTYYDNDWNGTAATTIPTTGVYNSSSVAATIANDINTSKSLSTYADATTDALWVFKVTGLTSAGAGAAGAKLTVTASSGCHILGATGLPTSSRTWGLPTSGSVSFQGLATAPGTCTYTATAGTASTSWSAFVADPSGSAVRSIAISGAATGTANGEGVPMTVTVKDRWGNPVKDVQMTVTASGVGAFMGGAQTASFTTDSTGKYTFLANSYVAAGGTGTFQASVVTAGDVSSPAGYVSTTPVNSDLAAGVKTATASVTFAAGTNSAQAAAEAANDAAAEAIDAANAATDAANLAAEAADAATVAAEEARDAADAATAAVEELATQVATLMAALKAQITTLANTVAKIAKKVKA